LNWPRAEHPSTVPSFAIPTATVTNPRCYSPTVAHLCALTAVVLICSARDTSMPRYFPHFPSCCALNAAHPLDATDRSCAATEWDLIPEQRCTEQWTRAPRPLLFPIGPTSSTPSTSVRYRRYAQWAATSSPEAAVLLRLRTAAVWSTSSSRQPPKEALKLSTTSSPPAIGSTSSWPAFSIRSLTPMSHPRALPDSRGARPPLQAHCRPSDAHLTVVPPRLPRVTVGSCLW
jgi:hypothetical protein